MVLWDYIPNKSSQKDIIQAMKENLELKEHKEIGSFQFSINKPYKKEIIGEGPYKNNFSYTLLPDFTGDTESQARATASRYGISVSFVGSSGTVVSQNQPARKRVDLIKGNVVLTLSGSSKNEKEKVDDKDDKNEKKDSEDNDKKETVKDDSDNDTSQPINDSSTDNEDDKLSSNAEEED